MHESRSAAKSMPANIGPLEVATVDQRQTGRTLREARAEGAGDAPAPGEAHEDCPGDSERGEKIGSNAREDRRPIRLGRQCRRLSVARCVQREHAQSVLVDQDRRDFVRMEATASEPVPVENRRPIGDTPFADEQRNPGSLGRELPH